MITSLTTVSLWVRDQEEARSFYADKLGFDVREDVTLPDMGGFRWLTVGPAGQDDIAVALMDIPGPPVFDEETHGQVNTLMAKGAAGTLFLGTDDCRKTYEELKGRGVAFTEEPSERPYGIDAALTDPSGNSIRIVQRPTA
jgi:catechol 2,3-dioxygenase-like lactoylglutathione lyase family enzyme